jgi:hypothetical protein
LDILEEKNGLVEERKRLKAVAIDVGIFSYFDKDG